VSGKLLRRKLLITGASGGMGKACTRLLGQTHDLVLNDISTDQLAKFAGELERDGYTICASVAGDLCDPVVLAALVQPLGGGAGFCAVHTAGLSPSQADWQAIMRVNLIGTALLMQALEPLVASGSVAILIASTAGHDMPEVPELTAAMAALEPGLIERVAPFIEGMAAKAGPAGAGGIAYAFSKQAVLRLGERKAMAWGRLGGRVVTISPGLMLTPMGRQELARTPGAQAVMDAAPVGRPGTAMDIAMVAQFLVSDEAAFISGSDVRVDGGAVSAMQIMAADAKKSGGN
jgi:NAD(P)-dependent dehydrogenase (short-subunit alcohol dehydrogenase family)